MYEYTLTSRMINGQIWQTQFYSIENALKTVREKSYSEITESWNIIRHKDSVIVACSNNHNNQ